MSAAFDLYRQIPGVNWSSLKHMAESPLHYKHALTVRSKSTPAQILGTAAHLAVLEPDAYRDEVAVWTEGRRAGKLYDAWKECNAGKLWLNAEEDAAARAMGQAVHANPNAAPLLRTGKAEVPIEWVDEGTGLPCKGRLDWLDLQADRAVIVDFKTTRTTDHRLFARQVVALGYHGQLAHYAAGVSTLYGLPVEVHIIAVESAAPHDVAVFMLTEALRAGRTLRDELLAKVAECVATDRWPGRHPEPVPLCLPAYALGDTDITLDDGVDFDASGEAL